MVGLVVLAFWWVRVSWILGFFSQACYCRWNKQKGQSFLFSFFFFLKMGALSGRSKTKEIELISETLISKSLVGFLRRSQGFLQSALEWITCCLECEVFVFEFLWLRDIFLGLRTSLFFFFFFCCSPLLCSSVMSLATLACLELSWQSQQKGTHVFGWRVERS